MTCRIQSAKCRFERKGVRIAKHFLGILHRENFNAPFDLVRGGVGYEVKAISANSKDKKIHVADSSLKRKLEYAELYGLKPVLMAVVVGDDSVAVYMSGLTKSIRISQMGRIL